MLEIRMPRIRSEEEMEAAAGQHFKEDALSLLIGEPGRPPARFKGEWIPGPAKVLDSETGELLALYAPAELDPQMCREAYLILREAKGAVNNRGTATGFKATQSLRRDGLLSRQSRVDVAAHPELSGVSGTIIGSVDRSVKMPTCRKTAFNMENPEGFAGAEPFIRAVSDSFRKHAPERWAAQYDICQRTHQTWVIPGTVFTTVTVNHNFRTALHTDRGDYRPGLGVMSALRGGEYRGCYTSFPSHGVGFDLWTGGVLMANVHEWHCNTPLHGRGGNYERVSCIFYYREKMHLCGSPEEEVRRAQNREPGDPIWDKAK